jgi:ABC-2 type transport system ATP-binding protein
MTARENYKFYGVINGLKKGEVCSKFESVSELLGLDRFANKRVEELTAGWRQLLSFSIAIMREPGILLLDEPTAGVDTLTREKIWSCIKAMSESGTTVLVTSHYASESAKCHRNINICRPEQ